MLRTTAIFCCLAALAACGPRPSAGSLVGRWSGAGGLGTLDIDDVGRDGTVAASYFTTHPIHIVRAEASIGSCPVRLRVWVEDKDFSPATFDLEWKPSTDQLRGRFEQRGGHTAAIFTRTRSAEGQ